MSATLNYLEVFGAVPIKAAALPVRPWPLKPRLAKPRLDRGGLFISYYYNRGYSVV